MIKGFPGGRRRLRTRHFGGSSSLAIGFGTNRPARRDMGGSITPSLKALALSAVTLAEASAPGAIVGTIQNGTAGSALSLTDDAGGCFAIASGRIVAGLAPTDWDGGDPGDYDDEGNRLYAIVIREALDGATGSPRDTPLTIAVTNIFEQPDLGALSLSETDFEVGTPDSGTINGATAGSTITATGLPDGLTIDGAARTWDWDGIGSAGTPSFSLFEALADSANSGRESVIGLTISAAPGGGELTQLTAPAVGGTTAPSGNLTIVPGTYSGGTLASSTLYRDGIEVAAPYAKSAADALASFWIEELVTPDGGGAAVSFLSGALVVDAVMEGLTILVDDGVYSEISDLAGDYDYQWQSWDWSADAWVDIDGETEPDMLVHDAAFDARTVTLLATPTGGGEAIRSNAVLNTDIVASPVVATIDFSDYPDGTPLSAIPGFSVSQPYLEIQNGVLVRNATGTVVFGYNTGLTDYGIRFTLSTGGERYMDVRMNPSSATGTGGAARVTAQAIKINFSGNGGTFNGGASGDQSYNGGDLADGDTVEIRRWIDPVASRRYNQVIVNGQNRTPITGTNMVAGKGYDLGSGWTPGGNYVGVSLTSTGALVGDSYFTKIEILSRPVENVTLSSQMVAVPTLTDPLAVVLGGIYAGTVSNFHVMAVLASGDAPGAWQSIATEGDQTIVDQSVLLDQLFAGTSDSKIVLVDAADPDNWAVVDMAAITNYAPIPAVQLILNTNGEKTFTPNLSTNELLQCEWRNPADPTGPDKFNYPNDLFDPATGFPTAYMDGETTWEVTTTLGSIADTDERTIQAPVGMTATIKAGYSNVTPVQVDPRTITFTKTAVDPAVSNNGGFAFILGGTIPGGGATGLFQRKTSELASTAFVSTEFTNWLDTTMSGAFHGLRVMSAMDINETMDEPPSATQVDTTGNIGLRRGALRAMVRRAKELGLSFIWVNAHDQAATGWAAAAAAVLKAEADAVGWAGQLFVEYSNEVWNSQFPQFARCLFYAAQRGIYGDTGSATAYPDAELLENGVGINSSTGVVLQDVSTDDVYMFNLYGTGYTLVRVKTDISANDGTKPFTGSTDANWEVLADFASLARGKNRVQAEETVIMATAFAAEFGADAIIPVVGMQRGSYSAATVDDLLAWSSVRTGGVRPKDLANCAASPAAYYANKLFDWGTTRYPDYTSTEQALYTTPDATWLNAVKLAALQDADDTVDDVVASKHFIYDRHGVDQVIYEAGIHDGSGSSYANGSGEFDTAFAAWRASTQIKDVDTYFWGRLFEEHAGIIAPFQAAGSISKTTPWSFSHTFGEVTPRVEALQDVISTFSLGA